MAVIVRSTITQMNQPIDRHFAVEARNEREAVAIIGRQYGGKLSVVGWSNGQQDHYFPPRAPR